MNSKSMSFLMALTLIMGVFYLPACQKDTKKSPNIRNRSGGVPTSGRGGKVNNEENERGKNENNEDSSNKSDEDSRMSDQACFIDSSKSQETLCEAVIANIDENGARPIDLDGYRQSGLGKDFIEADIKTIGDLKIATFQNKSNFDLSKIMTLILRADTDSKLQDQIKIDNLKVSEIATDKDLTDLEEKISAVDINGISKILIIVEKSIGDLNDIKGNKIKEAIKTKTKQISTEIIFAQDKEEALREINLKLDTLSRTTLILAYKIRGLLSEKQKDALIVKIDGAEVNRSNIKIKSVQNPNRTQISIVDLSLFKRPDYTVEISYPAEK